MNKIKHKAKPVHKSSNDLMQELQERINWAREYRDDFKTSGKERAILGDLIIAYDKHIKTLEKVEKEIDNLVITNLEITNFEDEEDCTQTVRSRLKQRIFNSTASGANSSEFDTLGDKPLKEKSLSCLHDFVICEGCNKRLDVIKLAEAINIKRKTGEGK